MDSAVSTPAMSSSGLVTLRRQVIDSLVGYSSFGPVSVDVGRRGPYVIGWRDEAGPMPVSIDNLQAQVYRASVEVLSVRPALATGQVTILPHQMGVDVIETEGDANAAGGGMMTLGEGSATWSIALPLEAAGIVPTEVEIIVGPDPSFVFSDPGGFGGFWPQGFTVEVQHPTTGEWTELGDLGQQSRVHDRRSIHRAELNRAYRRPRDRRPEQSGLRPGRRLPERTGCRGAGPMIDVPVVETRGLVKRYDDQLAVAGLDLVIGHGEIFGLVGPNGAGKTTTLKILATLLAPSSGEVFITGSRSPPTR